MPGLRIISGKVKGYRLKDVPGDSTRPITDMVREALFNILSSDIQNATLWDVFAGTGSVGLEALSRGARFVQFTENNRSAVQTLRYNIVHTGFQEQTRLLFGDAFHQLQRPPAPDRIFDYLYIAPPQYQRLWEKALLLLDENPDHLVPDGWAIVQIHPKEYLPLELSSLHLFEERKYGNTLLLFYSREKPDDPA